MNKLLKSKAFWIAAILFFCVICALIRDAISPDTTETPPETSETEIESIAESAEPPQETFEAVTELETESADEITTEATAIEYDSLQTVFLSVSDSFTADDLLELVNEYDLIYTEKEYTDTTTYKVAYSDDVAKQSHATDGDNIKISFYNDGGTIKYAEYFNSDLFVSVMYHDETTRYEYSYTDYSTSAILREDGSKSGLAETNYYESDSLENALISALSMK